jgi:hypothetical protein
MMLFSRSRTAMRNLPLFTLLLIGWMSALAALVQPALAAPARAPISPPDKQADAPAVALTRQGSVHIVWEQDGGLWYRNQRNGLWADAVQVAAEGENPALVADPYGEIVYLAWEQEFGGNYEIFSRKWDAVIGWSAPHNVSSNDGGSSAPALAVGPDGGIHLIWADTTPGASTLYHAISTDGESWPVALPIPDARGSNPTAAFAADGVLHVAWQYRASFAENLRIWTASYQNEAWSAPAAFTDGSQQAFAPVLAGNSSRLALVWQEGVQAKLAFAAGAGWRLDAVQAGQAPAVAITRDGVTEWAWETPSGLARQFGLGGWASPMTWSQAGGGDIALAVQNDRVGIVWTENQGDNRRVFYSDDILDTMYQPLMRK